MRLPIREQYQTGNSRQENPAYLTEQLITYIGNKRTLLDFIGRGLAIVKQRMAKEKLTLFDVFSGSGIVARFFKQFADTLYVNDLESYAEIINRCYLSNSSAIDFSCLQEHYNFLMANLKEDLLQAGLISEFYAPEDDNYIMDGERVFYTTRNAQYIDTARQLLEQIPQAYRHFFLAPLLSEASIHANTSGVFKGFYKCKKTRIGQFGGTNGDALFRIKGYIQLPFPVFSNFECPIHIYSKDSNLLAHEIPEIDVAYLDPPYNQHPYGSNYFMLNLITTYCRPSEISKVSGIPENWNRSAYNKRAEAYSAFKALVENIKAKYLLISFNSEGFITLKSMLELLNTIGKVTVLETKYNTFRGSRNLRNREIYVKEYLYLVEKR